MRCLVTEISHDTLPSPGRGDVEISNQITHEHSHNINKGDRPVENRSVLVFSIVIDSDRGHC